MLDQEILDTLYPLDDSTTFREAVRRAGQRAVKDFMEFLRKNGFDIVTQDEAALAKAIISTECRNERSDYYDQGWDDCLDEIYEVAQVERPQNARSQKE